MAGKFIDLMMIRGDDQTLNVQVVDNAGGIINITGSQWWFTVKNAITDPDPSKVFQKTLGDGITITNAVMGQLRVTIAAADTDGLPTNNVAMVYDLQMKSSLGEVDTINMGNFVVIPDVTRGTS